MRAENESLRQQLAAASSQAPTESHLPLEQARGRVKRAMKLGDASQGMKPVDERETCYNLANLFEITVVLHDLSVKCSNAAQEKANNLDLLRKMALHLTRAAASEVVVAFL